MKIRSTFSSDGYERARIFIATSEGKPLFDTIATNPGLCRRRALASKKDFQVDTWKIKRVGDPILLPPPQK